MKILKRHALRLPGQNNSGPGVKLKPGESITLPFKITAADHPVIRRLRITGETDVFWRWREEPSMPNLCYRSIEDALDSAHAFNEKYCLHLHGNGESWPRNAWLKIPGDKLHPGKKYKLSVRAGMNNLKVDRTGEALVELGIYRRKAGRHPDDAFDPPDLVESIAFPPGTRQAQAFCKSFSMPEDAVLTIVRVGAKGFKGDIWIDTPRLADGAGDSEIPLFSFPPMHNSRYPYNNFNYWLGENLSRKEWPEFEIAIDGRRIFAGAVFNAIYRSPDFELTLPGLRTGRHKLGVKLLGDYISAPCFNLLGAELLEAGARSFEIVSYPEFVHESMPFGILVRTCRNNVKLHVSGSQYISVNKPIRILKEPGLYAVECKAEQCALSATMTLSDGHRRETINIRQILRRADDGIRLSTGDAVYIAQTPNDFLNYLEWYVANRIGNAMCFRPVYRWSGSRIVNPAAWKAIIPLLEKLNMDYSLMVDGRELPGKNANPRDQLIKGPHYLGRQAHENDGAFCYWGRSSTPDDSLFADIFQRSLDKGGIFPAVRPVRRAGELHLYFDCEGAKDMRAAADMFMENLRQSKGDSTRHTGPSTLFRYFYQAGYNWLGSEQMYGPEEIFLSSLRGASRAYGHKNYGAHLAVQWSSGPHDTPEHAARYFLSLATCYLQGVQHINTEEGLWRMEANYAPHDRFSSACVRHRQAHAKFRRFMEYHERRGTPRIPCGIVQGYLDGWRGFGRGNVWEQTGPDWKFGLPEESFDLLNVFYPRSVLDIINRFPCPRAPQGWYSGTPYGPVDLFPIEAPLKMIADYQAIAFLGWNTYRRSDFGKLLSYVRQGGKLLLALPHLAGNIKRGEASRIPRFPELIELLGPDFSAPTSLRRRKIGKGEVVFFPQDVYPADPRIRSLYEHELHKLGELAIRKEREKGWIRGSKDINFMAYDRDDGKTRTIYLLNIDWWSGRKTAKCTFLFGDREYPLMARAGEIEVITMAGNTAVMPESPEVDVIGIEEQKNSIIIQVQSAGPAHIKTFDKQGSPTPHRVFLERGGPQAVALKKNRL